MSRALTCLLALSLPTLGCAQRLTRAVAEPQALSTLDRAAPFLKVHMRDGSLYTLSAWAVREAERSVSGAGRHYGADRQVLDSGTFAVAIGDVVLFETNVAHPSPSVSALTLLTGISTTVTLYCASNAKACFGSCPTFYVTDGQHDLLQAEGFSASIAPTLEARDVDHLYRARLAGPELQVDMANEAYETHVVRYVNVLAVPVAAGGRVFQDDTGGFWHVTVPAPPTRCLAPEGDCSAALSSFDGQERRSSTDSTDLAAPETIELVFEGAREAPALVLASRQSLLPTFLLYETFGYLGSSVGQWLATLERTNGAARQPVNSVVETLGGIDVLVLGDDGTWRVVARVMETGPLAADVRIVPLPATKGFVRTRLRMAKGAWRIDWAALVNLQGPAEPLRIAPTKAVRDGRPVPQALAKLLNPNEALVTFPGDRYRLTYRLPQGAQQYELFLESRGYYLEWMREEWLAEENPLRAAAMFLDPAASLRRLAPEFKKVEAQLDSAFWRSKYAR